MTATTERALPGMSGAIHHGDTGGLAVDTAVDVDDWNVTLDVTAQVDWRTIIGAIYADAHLLDAVRILRYSRNDTMRARAAQRFCEHELIQKACTLTLTPAQADALGNEVDEASREPYARCQWYDAGRGCSNFVTDKGEICEAHQAAADAENPVDEPIRDGAWS